MRSLRHQLAFTYAGIALLTTVLLGGILLLVLNGYYARAETAYLDAAARRITSERPRSTDAAALITWARLQALATQTRVRVIGADGTVIADSGSPRDVDATELLGEGQQNPGAPGHGRDRLPRPLGDGIFGAGSTSNDGGGSNRSLSFAVEMGGGTPVTVRLSDAPT